MKYLCQQLFHSFKMGSRWDLPPPRLQLIREGILTVHHIQTVLEHNSDKIPVPMGQTVPIKTTYDKSKQYSLRMRSVFHSAMAQDR